MTPECLRSQLLVSTYYSRNKARSSETSRRWRVANPERSRELNRHYQQRKMDFVREVLGTVCVDCAESRPEAVHYHHPNGRGSDSDGRSLSARSWAKIKEAMMQLIVLCATCHEVRHHREGTRGRPRTEEV